MTRRTRVGRKATCFQRTAPSLYCHLTEGSPRKQGPIVRGEVIGLIGRTGTVGASGRSHVQCELHRGPRNPVDPEPDIAGCCDPKKTYS